MFHNRLAKGYPLCPPFRGNLKTFSTVVSADGRKILAVGSNTGLSTNSGLTWATTRHTSHCAGTSADGTKMVVSFFTNISAAILVSTDTGNSWTPTPLPLTNWQSCASSADGSKLAATVGRNSLGLIYTSTNSGLTWFTNNVPTKDWRAIASSANGSRLAAAANNDLIYVSTNSGSTWNPATGTSGAWVAICSSIDGLHLVVTGARTGISGDGGNTWAFTNIVGNCVACSADGSRLAIGNLNGAIYTSANYGLNWASTNIAGVSWFSLASSADGGELVAGADGGVWMWQDARPPSLKPSSLGNNVKLSWLVPATNFLLQQNTDLTSANWVTITNSPVLNLSNLQNEVVIPSTNWSGFYRMTTP